MESVIINGIEQKQIKQVKLYISIVNRHYKSDLQELPEQQRNSIASYIVNFMREIYLAEHPFDELDLCCNILTDAKHVVNYLQLPKADDINSRVAVSIDFDNMLSLSKRNYMNYLSNSLSLSNVQQKFIEKKQSVIGSRYNIEYGKLLAAPSAPSKSERKKYQHNREVLQIDFDGVVLHTFKTLTEAVNSTDIKRDTIWRCLNHLQCSAGGYVWRYADDDDF